MAYPSTFADIYGEVINKVRLDDLADLQKAKDWVNQAYAEVVIETEAVQDVDTMTMTANQSVYILDTDISRIKQMYVTPVGQTASRPLEPVSIEQLLEWNPSLPNSTQSGGATHYAMLGQTDIQFFPTPTRADVVTVYYVKLPTPLNANEDVPVLQEPYATECLVNGACFKAAVFLKDPDAALFKQLYEQSIQRLRGHLRRREGSMTRQFRHTRGGIQVPHDRSVDLRGW